MKYQPPYNISQEILNRVAAISEAVGRLTVLTDQARALRLRPSVAPAHPCAREIHDIRVHNRIRTIHGSLAIEGNTLSEAQIAAILEGKQVIAPPREVQEVKNALITSAPQVTPHVSPQVGELLALIQGEMGREALQDAMGLSDRKSFRERYLKPALKGGMIEMTIPEKPNSRLQKYRLTDKGRQWLVQHRDG